MDVKNTHSITKTEISVFGRQALDAERRRSPSLAGKVLRSPTGLGKSVLNGEVTLLQGVICTVEYNLGLSQGVFFRFRQMIKFNMLNTVNRDTITL